MSTIEKTLTRHATSRAARRAAAVQRFLVAAISYLLPTRFGGNEYGLDVSLTSHGTRILTAGVAIASFCTGSTRVRQVYFAVDKEEPTAVLLRISLWLLRRKGVRILVGDRRGPHSKYWHFLEQAWDGQSPFLLIDDDVIYPKGLADALIERSAGCLHNACARALRFHTTGSAAAPYASWTRSTERGYGPEFFATNVGGVVIKPHFALKLLELGERYEVHCRSADDIWFHWIAVHFRMPYAQVLPTFVNPIPIPWTQGNALHAKVNTTANDRALRAQYTKADIAAIDGHATQSQGAARHTKS